jgi:hypothetical protein
MHPQGALETQHWSRDTVSQAYQYASSTQPHSIAGCRPTFCIPQTAGGRFEEPYRPFSSVPATLEQVIDTSRLYDPTWLPELAPRFAQQ